MEVTNEMIIAAVRQAVKDKVIPTHADLDTYTHHYASVQRMLEAALEVNK
jgi:hypothetical protein